MLSFSVNSKKLEVIQEVIASYDEPAGYYMTLSGNVIDIEVPSENCSSVVDNDIVSFYRDESPSIQYYEEKFIKAHEYGNTDVKIKVSGFTDVSLDVVKAKINVIGSEQYLFLTFNKEHQANEADKDIKRVIFNDSEISELCTGDIFIKDGYFKYRKMAGGTSENISVRCVLYWNTDTEGEVKSCNSFVPCTLDGSDMKKTLALLLKDKNGVVDQKVMTLYRNYSHYRCWVKDQRFFYYTQTDDNFWTLKLKPTAEVRLRKGDPVINFGITTDFSPYLLLEDGVMQFLAKDSKNRVNKVVDYEKQQFVPVISGSSLYDVEKIRFFIHLRTRDTDWNVVEGGGWSSLREPDNVLLNNIFTEEDIYYQRKCVSETFLRLSFYDSVNRGSQKLLYTAKLYLDENRLWSEYVRQKINDFKYLPFCFTCTNKYDYNEKTEGFYLHLFPSNIEKLTEEGQRPTIYMRTELCSAKYGKTIPLTLPVYPNTSVSGSTYGKSSYYDGKTYMDTSNGKTDMAALNNDMYIKVYLDHDEKNKRYVWTIGKADNPDDTDFEINLYEPKMF